MLRNLVENLFSKVKEKLISKYKENLFSIYKENLQKKNYLKHYLKLFKTFKVLDF